MEAEIKSFHSADVYNLRSYRPAHEDNFGFSLQVMVGEKDIEGEDSFDMLVCTPKWIEENHAASDVIFGEHHLIVFKYDFAAIKKKILDYIAAIDAEDWETFGDKMDRIGCWEFRDYQEYKPDFWTSLRNWFYA